MDKETPRSEVTAQVRLVAWIMASTVLMLLLVYGVIVAGIVALFNAVAHGPNVVNMSFAVLGAVIALRYIAGGATYVLKKRGKVKS